MNKDTYEFERKGSCKLEVYEWDDIWIDNADKLEKERILFIGDSITRGARPFINEILNKKDCYADQIATSKAVDNPSLVKLIEYVIAQYPCYNKIQFMFGGHGWHMSYDDYYYEYKKLVEYFMKKYTNIKFVIANFTPIVNSNNHNEYSKNNDVVIEKNKISMKIADELGLAFTDVYSTIANEADKRNLYSPDGVHFSDDGYKLIAKKICSIL